MEALLKQKIDKSQINTLAFGEDEVLNNSEEIAIRWQQLNKALKLGNIYKTTVQINFRSREGFEFQTEGTVWALTENYVILKHNHRIPVSRILKVII